MPNANRLRVPAFEELWYGSDLPAEFVEAVYANRLLRGYGRETLGPCLPLLRYARLPPHTIVTDLERVPRRVYLLLRGEIVLQTRRYGSASRVGVLHAGDFFGEASVLRLNRHSYVTRCLGPTSLCSIPADDLLRSLRPPSLLGLNIADALHRRLQVAHDARDFGQQFMG